MISLCERMSDVKLRYADAICESADCLGHDRLLPPTVEGDVLLIANTGAYGRAMSSNYNLRAPAVELMI